MIWILCLCCRKRPAERHISVLGHISVHLPSDSVRSSAAVSDAGMLCGTHYIKRVLLSFILSCTSSPCLKPFSLCLSTCCFQHSNVHVSCLPSPSVSTSRWTSGGPVSGGSWHSTPSCTWAACSSSSASPFSCSARGTTCPPSTASCEWWAVRCLCDVRLTSLTEAEKESEFWKNDRSFVCFFFSSVAAVVKSLLWSYWMSVSEHTELDWTGLYGGRVCFCGVLYICLYCTCLFNVLHVNLKGPKQASHRDVLYIEKCYSTIINIFREYFLVDSKILAYKNATDTFEVM